LAPQDQTIKVGLDYSDRSCRSRKALRADPALSSAHDQHQVDMWSISIFAGFRKELGKDVEIALECQCPLRHRKRQPDLHTISSALSPAVVRNRSPQRHATPILRIRNNSRLAIAALRRSIPLYRLLSRVLESRRCAIAQPIFTKTRRSGLRGSRSGDVRNLQCACWPRPHVVCTHSCATHLASPMSAKSRIPNC